MTDKEFVKLQLAIEEKIVELNRLHAEYRKETGRWFVFGQPINIQREV